MDNVSRCSMYCTLPLNDPVPDMQTLWAIGLHKTFITVSMETAFSLSANKLAIRLSLSTSLIKLKRMLIMFSNLHVILHNMERGEPGSESNLQARIHVQLITY